MPTHLCAAPTSGGRAWPRRDGPPRGRARDQSSPCRPSHPRPECPLRASPTNTFAATERRPPNTADLYHAGSFLAPGLIESGILLPPAERAYALRRRRWIQARARASTSRPVDLAAVAGAADLLAASVRPSMSTCTSSPAAPRPRAPAPPRCTRRPATCSQQRRSVRGATWPAGSCRHLGRPGSTPAGGRSLHPPWGSLYRRRVSVHGRNTTDVKGCEQRHPVDLGRRGGLSPAPAGNPRRASPYGYESRPV